MLLPLILAVLSPCAQPMALAPQSGAVQRLLDKIVGDNHGWGGGIYRVVGRHGRVLFDGASGNASHLGAPIQADASFEIASTSKAVTAAAVLLQVEAGRLDLDLPISTWLPPSVTTGLLVINGHDYGPELTLRQLLSHTSGLADYWYDPPYVVGTYNSFLFDYVLHPNHFYTPDEILQFLPDLDPIGLPGQQWHYSDSGYLLAGMILEQVSGQSLQDLYRQTIFQPLGMSDTFLRWRDPVPGNRQLAHRYEGTWNMSTHRHNSADWAGGGLASTTHDLDAFLRGLADGQLYAQSSTFAEMTTWIPTGETDIEYGLGLFHVNLGAGMGWIWGHDGYGNSWMYYWPKHEVSFCGTLDQSENDWWPLVEAAAFAIDH